MRSQTISKCLSALLSVAMVVGSLPTTAIAEMTDETEASVEEAVIEPIKDDEGAAYETDSDESQSEEASVLELELEDGIEADEEGLESENLEGAAGQEVASEADSVISEAPAEPTDNEDESELSALATGWTTSGTCEWMVDGDGALIVRPVEGTEGTLEKWGAAEESPWYAQRNKIVSARFEGTVHAPSCQGMFMGCAKLASVNFTGLDTSEAWGMFLMFDGCSKLTALDLTGLDTSSVQDMAYMFRNCSRLVALSASRLDTSRVTYMYNMFSGCSSLASLNLSSWDTSSVADMSGMFSGCSALASLNLSSWDTSSVTRMSAMFYGCSSLASLDLSSWDTSSVVDMSGMFSGCSKITTLGLTDWDTALVTDMSNMFYYCSALAMLDLSGWDTSYVSNMGNMFRNCSSLASLNLSDWDTSSVTDMSFMFENCFALASLDLSDWDTSRVADMREMFYNCSALTSLDLSGWVTSSVTSMDNMFGDCSSLASLDLAGWVTSSVTSMYFMFYDCSALSSLDLSGWDTSRVTYMFDMFYNCSALTTITLGQDFTFNGLNDSRSCSFPNFTLWKSATTGTMYAYDAIPNNVADTYVKLINIADATVASIVDQTYTSSAIKPTPKVTLGGKTLVKGTDYTLVYKDNTEPGTAIITITGKGDYAGTKEVTFQIVRARAIDISGAALAKVADQVYTGKAIGPDVVVTYGGRTLVEGTDYYVSYTNNVAVGTATIKISGIGDFAGTKSVTFKIVSAGASKVSISKATVAAIAAQTYTGKALKPATKVTYGGKTLKAGTDYTVAYKSNVGAGTATATLTGKGSFTGTKSVTFKIAPAAISKATVASIAAQTYTGKALKPAPKVTFGGKTLKVGTDYTLSYANNTKAGTATITLTGKGNFSGSRKVTFKISPASISKASVTVTDQAYTGKARTPQPKVVLGRKTLKPGTDYTIKYANNTDVGPATITLTGKGNYTGTKKATFRVAFSDVPASHPFYDKIHRANELGIISGYNGANSGKFGPADNITRGQIAVMLWKAAKTPNPSAAVKSFSDVKTGTYYYDAVMWAASVGVVSGYADNTFGPNDNITREQLAVMVANYAKRIGGKKISGSAADLAKLPDGAAVSGYAVSAVAWCYKQGIIVLQDGRLNAKSTADRATAAQMVCAVYDLLH